MMAVFMKSLIRLSPIGAMSIFCIVFFCLSGCGLSAKRGDLPLISNFPKIAKKSSVTYRVYVRSELGKDKVSLRNDESFEKSVEKSLIESGFFETTAKDRVFEETNDRFYIEIPKEKEAEQVSVEQVDFKTDFYLDAARRPKILCGTGAIGWAILHWASLGLIPMVFDNYVEVTVKLYDKNKKLIDQREMKDDSSLIAWSPYIFTRRAPVFPKFEEAQSPLEVNLLNNYLSKINQDGVLTQP